MNAKFNISPNLLRGYAMHSYMNRPIRPKLPKHPPISTPSNLNPHRLNHHNLPLQLLPPPLISRPLPPLMPQPHRRLNLLRPALKHRRQLPRYRAQLRIDQRRHGSQVVFRKGHGGVAAAVRGEFRGSGGFGRGFGEADGAVEGFCGAEYLGGFGGDVGAADGFRGETGFSAFWEGGCGLWF